jgi:hypothetical protein
MIYSNVSSMLRYNDGNMGHWPARQRCRSRLVRRARGYEPDAWEASVCVNLDAGEDMRHLAAELATFLA